MKQHEVFKKIGTIIQELNDQYEYLVNNESELNDLELELFVANAHFLANHLEILQKLNLHNTSVAEIVQPENEATAPSQIDANQNHIDVRGYDAGTDYSYIGQEIETIRHELIVDEIANLQEGNDETANSNSSMLKGEIIEAPQSVIENVDRVNSVAEKLTIEPKSENAAEEPLTINQKMSAQLNNTATGHLHNQSIIDLKQAITLNDKLLYIKDLFNGYNLAYNEAIDILNRCSTFDEADRFLKSNYSVKNNWETKQATVDKFYDLLERKYS